MYGKTNKPGTLQTAQMMCEKVTTSFVSDCTTRLMTPEDWEKYGPLTITKQRMHKKYLANHRCED
ncbi:hypothetical protein Desaci_4342 [Desulfosporosinus acidiphilus SJ4]|uniref:Uncharacterized protein n=1 Tax=Desulfosporosinus acidiphilus (strain DSM 22704 / JCM 16185 / SJ4) TaxID=646529 RepID=I4DBL8_DESAJ|nr:hypothetical protein [Desulfosporosinus acidiphilus]AFM43192.1 hypothetical protein Desaci_4342 [Desulfosporosinus acidiphilus SJ4]